VGDGLIEDKRVARNDMAAGPGKIGSQRLT
jgi:hypothetical protein